ncbi:hypothetical protein B7494_g6506 [Chlorociboria aeruginascens]|nr:hypothetical protein B7494_g6506 [Chlorociboria aeruginascens]
MESDDPFHWTVDRVVKELCTNERSWQPRTDSNRAPNSERLAIALKEQEVCGSVLLNDVDDRVMREDLELTVLGWRSFVRGAIQILRSRSVEYQKGQQSNSIHNIAASPFLQSPHDFSSNLPSRHGSEQGMPLRSQFNQGFMSPIDMKNSAMFRNYPPDFPPNDPQPSTPDNQISSNSKRRKLDLMVPLRNTRSKDINHLKEPIGEDSDTNAPTSALPETEVDGKKRKRIAPTLITPVIDPGRNRDIPTEADNVIQNDPHVIEPGVPFRGDDGRKRLVPVCQSYPNSDTPYNYEDLRRAPEKTALDEGGAEGLAAAKQILEGAEQKKLNLVKETLSSGYLGKAKMSVDDIFYGETAVGQELPTLDQPHEFSISQRSISSGRRLYVNGVMKNFLRSEPQIFERDSQVFSALRPYSSKLAPKFKKPSFTLFYSTPDAQIHAKRDEISSWPEIDTERFPGNRQNLGDERYQAIFNPPGPNMAGDLGSHVDWDPSCLERYKFLEGGDELLPVYGDSGSENDYDSETLEEIGKEIGVFEQPGWSLERASLSLDEVNQAIDEGIAEIVVKWNTKKFPKKQRKARSIWAKSRRNGTKKARIQEVEEHLENLTKDRIPKLRKEILEQPWTSQRKVRNQCSSMEVSIFDREDLKWELLVLRSKVAPEKPSPLPTPSEKILPMYACDDEEGESLETDSSSVGTSEDELEDFIIPDNSTTTSDEQEINLADGEEDDETMSDASVLPMSQKIQKRAHRKRLHIDQDLDNDERSLPPDVKAEPTLPSIPPSFPKTENFVDLTSISGDDNTVVNLITPEKKRKNRIILRTTPVKVSSDSDEFEMPDMGNLPPLRNVTAVARFKARAWAKVKDRDRLLISMIFNMDWSYRNSLFAFISDISENELWSNMMQVAPSAEESLKGIDKDTAGYLRTCLFLFESYVDCKSYSSKAKLKPKTIEKLEAAQADYFNLFYTLIQRCENLSRKPTGGDLEADIPSETEADVEDSEDEEPRAATRRRSRPPTSEEDEPERDTPRKKRKHKIFEDASARELREQDRHRLLEQDERRKLLRAKLLQSDSVGGIDQDRIIINDSKFDDQGCVYVNEKTAPRIKPHQIEGIRFLWNQIMTNGKEPQGCLLAHTMGLGKTMQTITLLVAIAEASSSNDESVSSQVPESLRVSKTLVICPPTLIDNWMDELLTWTPEIHPLGQFYKVDSSKRVKYKFQPISEWFQNGGVLIIGYEMFRNFYHIKKNIEGPELERYEKARTELLEGPNIVIADEAHKMKNSTAAITIAATNFRTQSRIALTGSPLANNVEEYHTMVEWVAPNYLGPIVEFRAKYAEPIQSGLYVDSTPAERRKMLKMLGVLREDLAPKVHRADMSVLRNDLPLKREFVITVALTRLQYELYCAYVQLMQAGSGSSAGTVTKSGQLTQTTIWHWMAILQLICSHPACFQSKLSQRKQEARQSQEKYAVLDEEDAIAAELNAPGWKMGVSEELVKKATKIFEKVQDIDDPIHSSKVKILCQILDHSKAAGDKVLVFSQSLEVLDFLERLCEVQGRKYARLDGSTKMNKRQALTKAFNTGDTEICLISTNAGGLGLNLFGANRVIIFDFKYNPVMEEQAVGRAYRIGQIKPVFVYRFVAGGTFEETIHNSAVFKMQLASRVVDKKDTISHAKRNLKEFLFIPRTVDQKDLDEFDGMDPEVLDKILTIRDKKNLLLQPIRAIVQSETFERVDNDQLTVEEQKEVDQLVSDEKLKRSDPKAYDALVQKRLQEAYARDVARSRAQQSASMSKAPSSVTHQASRPVPSSTHSNGVAQAETPVLSSSKPAKGISTDSSMTSGSREILTPANSKATSKTPKQTPTPFVGKGAGPPKVTVENRKEHIDDTNISSQSSLKNIVQDDTSNDSAISTAKDNEITNVGSHIPPRVDSSVSCSENQNAVSESEASVAFQPDTTPESSLLKGVSVPARFEALSDADLKQYLADHNRSQSGSRSELISRCVTQEIGLFSRPCKAPEFSTQQVEGQESEAINVGHTEDLTIQSPPSSPDDYLSRISKIIHWKR